MSCYFTIYAVNKNAEKIMPIEQYDAVTNKENEKRWKNYFKLFILTTTPARDLADEVGPFVYGKHTPLSESLLQDIISYYQEKIKDYQEIIEKNKLHLQKLWELLPQASTVEVYEKIKEEIAEAQEYDCEEELNQDIDTYNFYLASLRHIKWLMNDSKDNWDFLYSYA